MEMKEKIKELYQKEHIENGLSYKEIQKKHNIPRGTWQYYVNKWNYVYDGRTFRCNDDYFDVIDNYKKAYILGFLYADGCITADGRIMSLLNEKDIEVLEFIKDEICPTLEIKHSHNQNIKRDPQVQIRFTSKQLYSRLIELGFELDKTGNDSDIFNYIPEEFKFDFIRGYTDGDGNIRCQYRQGKLKNGTKSSRFYWTNSFSFTNGSKQILEDIQNYLLKFDISNGKLIAYKNVNTFYTLSYHRKNDTLKFCKLIYSDLNKFALQRKKELALKTIEVCSNTEVN
jgi:intein/homing endonuclease